MLGETDGTADSCKPWQSKQVVTSCERPPRSRTYCVHNPNYPKLTGGCMGDSGGPARDALTNGKFINNLLLALYKAYIMWLLMSGTHLVPQITMTDRSRIVLCPSRIIT